jgi:predicted RNA-binding protein with RPS1 domain
MNHNKNNISNSENNTPISDDIFNSPTKYNENITVTEEDAKAGIKIYCKEPYAQELYDTMKAYENESGINLHACKDLTLGSVYDVKATKISFDDKVIHAEEINSKVEITIPFNEFAASVDDLSKGENIFFNVMIIKTDKAGAFVGSEKDCMAINYKNELTSHYNNRTWFEITIKKLIKGGYVASYKNTVDCFIPGSHAGANVIRDFSKLLGTTINVMVDNYDKSNDLFILSYKKYIAKSMPLMVSELKFGHKYTGILTNKPYDFGMFVEIDGYYTGLIHSSEFSDYSNIKSIYKAGDEVDVYIKNVTKKGKQFRVVLTLDPDSIDSEKKQWDDLRNRTEGESFEYDIDSNTNSIKIYIDGESYGVTLRKKDLQKNLDLYPKVKVFKVDPINKSLKFEFVENED